MYPCRQDEPRARMGGKTGAGALDWLRASPVANRNPSSTAFVWVCVLHPDYEVRGVMICTHYRYIELGVCMHGWVCVVNYVPHNVCVGS